MNSKFYDKGATNDLAKVAVLVRKLLVELNASLYDNVALMFI